jgi:hypothetical protein
LLQCSSMFYGISDSAEVLSSEHCFVLSIFL